MSEDMTVLSRDVRGLAALFATSGTVHLIRPQVFAPIMPRRLPWHAGIIYASGVAELVCAAGLLYPPTRKVAGWASAVLLVGIFPGNVQMAVNDGRRVSTGTGSRARQLATLVRLPLQLPLIRTALKAAGRV
jgi:uncharacterized membrane protein